VSYINSSDESVKGGSTSSQYLQMLRRPAEVPEVPPQRNRSSDHNHKSGGEIPLNNILRCFTGESEEERSPLLFQDPAILALNRESPVGNMVP